MKCMLKGFVNNSVVICLGEALIDRLGPLGGDPSVDKPVEDCFGGAPANVACGLARLGTRVEFVGRLGNDLIGNKFCDLMATRGVNLSGVQIDRRRPSRVVLVRREFNGERVFHGFDGDKGQGFADEALHLGELKQAWPQLSSDAGWILMGTIPLAKQASSEALRWALNQASRSGLKIAIDVNWRPTFWDVKAAPDCGPNKTTLKTILPLLEKASLLKLAKEEANWFFNSDEPMAISRLLSQNPDVVITDGARPLKWTIGGFSGQLNVLPPPVVLDTTGAGDAFTAGLINQLLMTSSEALNDEKIQAILRFAAACGALVCGGMGAINPQPTHLQVEEFLAVK